MLVDQNRKRTITGTGMNVEVRREFNLGTNGMRCVLQERILIEAAKKYQKRCDTAMILFEGVSGRYLGVSKRLESPAYCGERYMLFECDAWTFRKRRRWWSKRGRVKKM